MTFNPKSGGTLGQQLCDNTILLNEWRKHGHMW